MVYDPPVSHYTQINAFENTSNTLKFMGKNGIHFKYLTNNLHLHYLWWNKNKNVFEIWGPHDQLEYAKTIIEYKMNKMLNNNNE